MGDELLVLNWTDNELLDDILGLNWDGAELNLNKNGNGFRATIVRHQVVAVHSNLVRLDFKQSITDGLVLDLKCVWPKKNRLPLKGGNIIVYSDGVCHKLWQSQGDM